MASGSRQPRKGAPNAGSGKRAWRTPIPHLSLSDRKVGQGLIVFTFQLIIVILLLILIIRPNRLRLRLNKKLARPPRSAQLYANNLTAKKLWDAFTTTLLKPSAARRW